MKKLLYVLHAVILITALLEGKSTAQDQNYQTIHASIQPDRQHIFIHETFKLVLSIRSAGVQLAQEFQLQGLPGSDNLQLLSGFQEISPVRRETVSNNVFETRMFMADARAMKSGQIQFSPVLRVGIMVQQRVFIGTRWVQMPHDIPMRSVDISIMPLPETGRPTDFSGAVGLFSFDVAVSPTDVALGDLITATMTVKGSGYLENILPPRISPGRNFKAYNPEPIANDNADTRIFKQIIVPQTTNAVEICAASFSFFDPQRNKYAIVSKGPFPLTFHQQEKQIQSSPFRPDIQAEANGDNSSTVGIKNMKQTSMFHNILKNRFTAKRKMKMKKSENARLAPAHSALATFDLPEGALVQVLEASEDWVKISFNNKRGWIPVETLAP